MAESIGEVDALDNLGRAMIMMMIEINVIIIILRGKGIVKHLHRQADTVTAALTVTTGIVLELPSWVRQLWHSMCHASSGVEIAAGDVSVVMG